MPRAPRPDEPAPPAGAEAPWAADEARAGPTPAPGTTEAGQLPLFHADEPAPPPVRRARLRSRIKALLTARFRRRAKPPSSEGETPSGSSWPDSFFGP